MPGSRSAYTDEQTVLAREGEDDSGIETACYLCYAQCVNHGKHGNGVRPCAKNLVEVVSRENRLRRRSRAQGANKENSGL